LQAESFKRVEGKLYGYYDNLRNLEMLRAQLEAVEKDISDIRSLSTDTYELAASFGMVANYTTERVQGSKSIYHSPVEAAYQNMCENLEKLLARRVSIKMRIIKLEEQVDGIKFTLGQLDPFERKVVDYRYRQNMSTRQISRVLDLHKNSIERTRQKVVEELGRMIK
jgi:DNA-directed RNA polymerase specialized sigma subunit